MCIALRKTLQNNIIYYIVLYDMMTNIFNKKKFTVMLTTRNLIEILWFVSVDLN